MPASWIWRPYRHPGFIDCHVHLTMNAATLYAQSMDSSATKALTALRLAQSHGKPRPHCCGGE